MTGPCPDNWDCVLEMVLNKAERCWKRGSSSYYEYFILITIPFSPILKEFFAKTKSSENMLSLSVKHSKVLGVVFYIIQYFVEEEEIVMWKTLSSYQNRSKEGWETCIFQQRQSDVNCRCHIRGVKCQVVGRALFCDLGGSDGAPVVLEVTVSVPSAPALLCTQQFSCLCEAPIEKPAFPQNCYWSP